MGHGKFGGKGMMFANPSFEQMARHWFNFLCANCDNPPRKIPYYRLRPILFGH
jgi:hypothetical protein